MITSGRPERPSPGLPAPVAASRTVYCRSGKRSGNAGWGVHRPRLKYEIKSKNRSMSLFFIPKPVSTGKLTHLDPEKSDMSTHMAKTRGKASRKRQGEIVQMDTSSTRQKRGEKLQESVKILGLRFQCREASTDTKKLRPNSPESEAEGAEYRPLCLYARKTPSLNSRSTEFGGGRVGVEMGYAASPRHAIAGGGSDLCRRSGRFALKRKAIPRKKKPTAKSGQFSCDKGSSRCFPLDPLAARLIGRRFMELNVMMLFLGSY